MEERGGERTRVLTKKFTFIAVAHIRKLVSNTTQWISERTYFGIQKWGQNHFCWTCVWTRIRLRLQHVRFQLEEMKLYRAMYVKITSNYAKRYPHYSYLFHHIIASPVITRPEFTVCAAARIIFKFTWHGIEWVFFHFIQNNYINQWKNLNLRVSKARTIVVATACLREQRTKRRKSRISPHFQVFRFIVSRFCADADAATPTAATNPLEACGCAGTHRSGSCLFDSFAYRGLNSMRSRVSA